MSYLHRPGVGGQQQQQQQQQQPSVPGGGGGGGGSIAAGQQGAMTAISGQQHGGLPAGASRLSDLLDYVKGEFEAVSTQAETLRRDNHDYAAHADMHLSEVSAIRRELTELEREHSRAKQAYEEKIADLKRQIETSRAQTGQGPPIPSVMPASTNHFGALMGHPHGMFGQGGPAGERERMMEIERERERGERDPRMLNGGGGGAERPGPNGMPSLNTGPGASSNNGPGAPNAPPPQQAGRPGYPPQHHHQDTLDRAHDRDGIYHQQLGKRTRPEDARDMYDGQPPAAKTRVGPHENGVESRTSAAASFPPIRPPSRTYAQSPHGPPGRPMSAASGPTIANAPPSEPSVLSQPHPGAGAAASSSSSSMAVDVKPQIGSLNPPIQLQRPGSHQGPAPPSQTGAPQSHEERAKRQEPPPPAQARQAKQPDWDVSYNHEVPKKLDVTLAHTFLHDSVVCCVRISPDGKLLATGCNRNTTLYDTKTGVLVAQLAEEISGKPDNYIRAVAFSPDGTRLASGSEDKVIRIWDLSTRKMIKDLRGHESEIYSLAFSPDGKQIVSGSGDKTARIWSVETGKVLNQLKIQEERRHENGSVLDAGVTSIAISPDGKLLVAGSLDHVVRIWDMHTGQLLDKLKSHKDSVYSVAFLPGGSQLLTGSLDKTLKVWDLTPLRQAMARGAKTDPEQQPLSTCKQTFSGHRDFVLSVAASPDGNWITSGSKDRAVQCWDVRTGKPQFVLHGHKNSVISIAMSEIGGLLATGSGDWQARIFKISGMDEPVAPVASQAQTSQQPRQATPLVPQTTTNTTNAAMAAKSADNVATAKETTKSNSSSAAPEQAKENGGSTTAAAPAETNGQHNKEGSAPAVAAAPAPVLAKEAIQAAAAQRDSTPTVTLVGSVASSPSAMKVDPPSSATKAEAHPKVASPTASTAKETQEKASTSNEAAQGATAA